MQTLPEYLLNDTTFCSVVLHTFFTDPTIATQPTTPASTQPTTFATQPTTSVAQPTTLPPIPSQPSNCKDTNSYTYCFEVVLRVASIKSAICENEHYSVF